MVYFLAQSNQLPRFLLDKMDRDGEVCANVAYLGKQDLSASLTYHRRPWRIKYLGRPQDCVSWRD